ncbi:MAG TPA: hypothetical protein VK928_05525 [Longimicrobiales bacterium]|nr:hypothetical protein [Longimicrobiales bacterium]
MTPTDTPAYPASEVEGLIGALRGVLAAQVAMSTLGRIEEVHVLADEQLHPKQVVRNIESALCAGLGVTVDRRLISVAQVRGNTDDILEEDDVAPDPEPDSDRDRGIVTRYVFVGYDASTQADLEASCRVTIRRGDEVISGSGTGPSTQLGRAQAAARAVFGAIATARRDQTLALEGVSLVETHGQPYILVSAHAIVGRATHPLTGIAPLHRSPEEAAILAALQSTNRWAELDG